MTQRKAELHPCLGTVMDKGQGVLGTVHCTVPLYPSKCMLTSNILLSFLWYFLSQINQILGLNFFLTSCTEGCPEPLKIKCAAIFPFCIHPSHSPSPSSNLLKQTINIAFIHFYAHINYISINKVKLKLGPEGPPKLLEDHIDCNCRCQKYLSILGISLLSQKHDLSFL